MKAKDVLARPVVPAPPKNTGQAPFPINQTPEAQAFFEDGAKLEDLHKSADKKVPLDAKQSVIIVSKVKPLASNKLSKAVPGELDASTNPLVNTSSPVPLNIKAS